MRRPLPVFALFVAVYLSVLGFGWFRQGLTAGELIGHAAKIESILRLLRSGDFAWSPDYMTGAPAVTLMSFAASVPAYAPALALVSDPIVAMKITGLALLALGGFAAYAFGARLDRNGWTGFALGCAYLLSPQLLLRLGWQEHMTIVTAVPLVPLTFLALLRVAERGTPWDALLLAVSYSATLLAWSKMGATLAIPLAVFALWLFFSRPECRGRLVRGALWSTPLVLLLGVVPLLPLFRERGLMTVFELDPFAQWQAAYSAKSATSWLDRDGSLLMMLPRSLHIDRGGYYLGIVGFLAVAWTAIRTWQAPRLDPRTTAVRIFAFIALLMFWISLGPRTVWQGHFEILASADALTDFAIPLHWLLLAAQGAFLFWCTPRCRWRTTIFLLVFGIYLFAPAFRLLEKFPLFSDLRAPDSFWILNGTFAWCVAAALAVVGLLATIPRTSVRIVAAICALAAAAADFAPYFKPFRAEGLSSDLLSDYRKATDSLAAGSGRVYPITGRYFPLDLPLTAGRPLSTEALNRYLMPTDTARMQRASRISATDLLTYMRLSGIGSLLVDRFDSGISKSSEQWFRSLLPVSLENEGFLVLDNPRSLYPAFFAQSVTRAEPGYQEYVDALELGALNHLVVANPLATNDTASLANAKTTDQARAEEGPEFTKLDASEDRTPSSVRLNAPGTAGWVVLSESWHPDWTVTVDGQPRAVFRGAGGFPATFVRAADKTIEFRFRPPAWYSVCLVTGGIGWLFALCALVIVPVVPKARRRFYASPTATRHIPVPDDATPIARPLVIIPTYNEEGSITQILDAALAAGPAVHVLIVDDASPDGTAAKVRSHPAFGTRLHLLPRTGKLGLGSAYRDGFHWAMDRGYDACIEMDADFSHDPADIPRLIEKLNDGFDAAIGSRYLDGVRVINWPQHRLLLSAGASRFVRAITGLPLTDATSGFKALRTSALRAIDWSQLRADGYGFQVELHWLLWAAGCRIAEVPIVFTERRVGQTKMTAGIAFEAAWRVIQLALRDHTRISQEEKSHE